MNAVLSSHRWLLLLALLLPTPLWAAAGKVVIAAGDVFAIGADEEQRSLQRRSDIFEGDTLVTGENGRLQLRFEDNAILALRANSQLRISEYHGGTDSQQERVLMDLLAGGFRTISGSFGSEDRDAYQVRTAYASIGIRGTHYEAVLDTESLTVGVYDGGIVVTNDQGSLNLGLDSEFLYAQVQAGNLPQGLLNPPDNLNVPSTPGTEEEAGDEEEDEGDGSETDETGANDGETAEGEEEIDEGFPELSNNDLPGNIDNTGFDSGDFDTPEDNGFEQDALEDSISEEVDKQNPNSVVSLSDAEIEALQGETVFTGIMVFSPSASDADGNPLSSNGPLFAYSSSTTSDTINYFIVAYDSQNATELNGDFYLPNLVVRPDGIPTSDPDTAIDWEYWNASEDDIEVEAGADSNFNSATTDQPFFFILAEPTQASLSGSTSFSLCTDCLAVAGIGSSVTSSQGILEADFDTLNAIGHLQFAEGSNNWSLAFEGQINDATLSASLADSITFNSGSQGTSDLNNSQDLSGNVNGIFTGEDSGELSFVGGFSAESDGTDDEAYGVFVMDEDAPE